AHAADEVGERLLDGQRDVVTRLPQPHAEPGQGSDVAAPAHGHDHDPHQVSLRDVAVGRAARRRRGRASWSTGATSRVRPGSRGPGRVTSRPGRRHAVAEPIDAMVDLHLAVWNGPAGAGRDTAVAELYAPDVLVAEPDRARHGHAGMDEAGSALQAQFPGTVITRTGPIQVVQDLVTYPWTLGTPGEPPLASGRDVLLVRDGMIASLYVVLDPA